MSLQILLSGASGTIGQTLVEEVAEDDRFSIVGVASSEQFFEPDLDADVIIDFSHPRLLEKTLDYALRHRLPLVTGTTGLDGLLHERLSEAARTVPVCHAANFSVGLNLLLRLATEAARLLGEDFDIELTEMHHRRKIDAPSGTALALARALAGARGLVTREALVQDRSRHRIPRSRGEIGVGVLRGGDVAGEHTVYFLGDGERLELTHRASDRRIFARGALLAATRLLDKPPGLVEFSDLVMGDRR
ncbi:MAG: 4-hydroxy-tetrahydrodipicolinate reductase [Wenzhouxiangella sp.]|nr:MAG: 4-hydroxy-tetrahydrodipicolinate reductase [Wenzhouxiangella sp.]